MAVVLLLTVLVVWAVLGLPAYIIANKRGVKNAWVAFVPIFGPTIALLESMERSGWMCLLGLIPLVNIVFSLWILFAVPVNHGRTAWWGAALLVPLVGMYAYAWTLADAPGSVRAGLAS